MEEKWDEDNHNNSILRPAKVQISSNLSMDRQLTSKELKISAPISPSMTLPVIKKWNDTPITIDFRHRGKSTPISLQIKKIILQGTRKVLWLRRSPKIQPTNKSLTRRVHPRKTSNAFLISLSFWGPNSVRRRLMSKINLSLLILTPIMIIKNLP